MGTLDNVAGLQALHWHILEGVASGRPLHDLMSDLCRDAEALARDAICSVLSVDPENRLRHLAGPSLPAHYIDAIDGTSIGPCAGSCGTAAFRGETVEVQDIASDPLWAEFKDLALPIGLQACWSSPIRSQDGRVIGTFAFYYPTQRGPSDIDRRIVSACVHLCSIAIEHDAAQSRIRYLAYHDALTGLANRTSFQQKVTELLATARDSEASFAVHLIDLDNFKDINDTSGHSTGDVLLQQVAQRLASSLQEGEMAARLGGDEFAVLQVPVRRRRDVAERARMIVARMDEPFLIDRHVLHAGATVGAVEAPRDGVELGELLRKADVALYRAKSEGRGSHSLFAPEMESRQQARRSLEADLRKAADNGGFSVAFQPIVNLASGAPAGAEALARWHRPGWGDVSPAEFVPILEETGRIGVVGSWILHEACRAARSWPAHATVAVNLSSVQLRKPQFAQDVALALGSNGIAPHRLELEITESVPLVDNKVLRRTLHELKELGVKISLDDFGTGYSSLSYLRAFPFDRIKIDREFIADIGRRPDATSIVRAAIGLARDLAMRTTAEGVATHAQEQWLLGHGCQEGQGFLFGRPCPAADIAHRFTLTAEARLQQRAVG